MTIDAILDGIIEREGGFTNNPNDAGKATKYGITAATLGDWRKLGRHATDNEVRALEEPEARAIYRKEYVEDPGFAALASDQVRLVMVDCGVLHGPAKAIEMMQLAIGDPNPDGKLGPVTLTIVNAMDGRKLAMLILLQRAEKFGRIISHDQTQYVFAHGWLRSRVGDIGRWVLNS